MGLSRSRAIRLSASALPSKADQIGIREPRPLSANSRDPACPVGRKKSNRRVLTVRDALDLDQKLRAREPRDDHGRARRRIAWEERAPHLVHRRKVRLTREEHGAFVHL